MAKRASSKRGGARARTGPKLVVLAGPNGAGKSTVGERILRGPLKVDEFVNADVIARGLSGFAPERVALAAGRIMLGRIKELAATRISFAFETTLASRTFAPWIAEIIAEGYEFHLVYLWLPSAEAAVARVADRVRSGGHDVPETTIRRRYVAGLKNFFSLYQPLATTWQVVDNSEGPTKLIATGNGPQVGTVADKRLWQRITRHEIS